jgi:hypothetical protein
MLELVGPKPIPNAPSTSDAAKPATANNSNVGMTIRIIGYSLCSMRTLPVDPKVLRITTT